MKTIPIVDATNKELKKTSIPLRNFSDYFLENVALNRNPSQLQITSVCDAACFYCSNDQNEFDTQRSKMRSIEEIEKVIWNSPVEYQGPFHLNESLPGRISEGEATVHPKFFEILDVIRLKYTSNDIRITTSGSRLTPEFVTRLAEYRPVTVTMSIPSVDELKWCEIYKLKKKHFDTAMESIPLMQTLGISVDTHMTPMPSYVGYADIERTFQFFDAHNLRHVYIYAAGYTKFADESFVERMSHDKYELSDFLHNMSYKYNIHMEWPMDPNGLLSVNYDGITNRLKQFFQSGKKSYWFTSVGAFDRFSKLMNEMTRTFPVDIEIVKVENRVYGGNIESAGLWMVNDIRDKVNELGLVGQHIVCPGSFLDLYGFDLNGENIIDYLKVCRNSFYFL